MNAHKIIKSVTLTLVGSTVAAVTAMTISFNNESEKSEDKFDRTMYAASQHNTPCDTVVKDTTEVDTLDAPSTIYIANDEICKARTDTTHRVAAGFLSSNTVEIKLPRMTYMRMPTMPTLPRLNPIKPIAPVSPKAVRLIGKIR